ncbi:hypothetical protein DL89DRAFT_257133 [Linderina pennispora]|uniref:Uncharacterized protein n=1 Tax=Linderina pennispora TaxID=61395 RepID=A0A1Y1WBP6_9FUNG|nr:uncharacterized protein DL89DRAFT_257133 [Linderina pennispora]ORX70971.1 hypothetical protein DL89DRAFT_257133 [Linderina pennispora]
MSTGNFADSIREQQLAARRTAEQLRLEVEYSTDAPKDEHTARLNLIESQMRKQQREFRAALLKYKGNSASAAKKERELLLSGAATPSELRKRKARTGNAVLNAATDVTTALQETCELDERGD